MRFQRRSVQRRSLTPSGVKLRAWGAILAAVGLTAALAPTASAHVGTSNAYFDGTAGPYGVRVIVRTPGVIPGLAEASVRILSGDGVERVTVRPLRSDVGLEGAPPPDTASPVPGEAGLYSGDLWLMTTGSYSVEVGVIGSEGEGTVFVPVLAVAERRLGMDPAVGVGLAAAGLFLFVGALTIVGAAVRESVLEPGREPDARRRWRGRFAMVGFALVLGATVSGGWVWWDAVDAAYGNRLYRPWSTTAEVAAVGGRQVLTLAIDDPEWRASEGVAGADMLPDHGKLMHMFLVRAADLSAFAHVHPVRQDRDSFTVPLPPLPAGDYRIYADIVHENGFAPTLVNTAHVPSSGSDTSVSSPSADSAQVAGSAQEADGGRTDAGPLTDPDDSWATLLPHGESQSGSYALPSGRTVHSEQGASIDADEEITLRFSVTESDGSPSALEPYMGMLSHAAVFRDDGSVFVHLHPAGSINLTAQMRFAGMQNAAADAGAAAGGGSDGAASGERHAGQTHSVSGPTNTVTFPFVFPEPGRYRIVVQVKIGPTVETAAFDVDVGDA